MTAEYLLPCECGQTIRVVASHAGQSISCECGNVFYAPTLRQLTQLEQVVNSETNLGNIPRSLVKRNTLVASGLLALISIIVLIFWAMYDSSTGPSAAIRFERMYRGTMHGTFEEPNFPNGRPIPFRETSTIKSLTQELWSQTQIESDFVAYRETLRMENPQAAQQLKGILVIVKTERCHQTFRSCATATAALEKQSTALLKHFRIYGAWIETNPDHRGDIWKKWEQLVIREYGFKLGPGPKICVFFPGLKNRYEADGKRLDLYIHPFEKLNGKTPLLEEFLQSVLKNIEDMGLSDETNHR